MRPQLIIDNSFQQPTVVNFMRAITASTLTQDTPCDMAEMLALLGNAPANTPTRPPTDSRNTTRVTSGALGPGLAAHAEARQPHRGCSAALGPHL